MKLGLLVPALLILPLVALAPTAAAWPPVCLVKEVGSEGGKAHAQVWVTCGPRVEAETCPKDGFCYEVSTAEDLSQPSPLAAQCYPLFHGPGSDSELCADPKGTIGCKVYTRTYHWESGTSTNCIA